MASLEHAFRQPFQTPEEISTFRQAVKAAESLGVLPLTSRLLADSRGLM